MRSFCKGLSEWDCHRLGQAVRALVVLEQSVLAELLQIFPGLGSPADLPVASAAGELEALVRCKEPAELSFSAVGREAGEVVPAAVAEEAEAVAADYFARPLIAFASAFTTATKIQHSTRSRIR